MGDFDESAIKFYKEYYGKSFSQNANKYMYSHSGESIEVAGDVCFNFTLKNGKFFTLYGSIIRDDEVFSSLNEQLEKVRYSPMNISIMPKTGGLNNIKKTIGNDRFDAFARLLSHYYVGNQVPIINGGAINMTIEQRLLLSKFLDSYSSVYDYFEDIYGISSFVTKDLVIAGSRLITTKDHFFEYINMAVTFWNDRLNQGKMKSYLKDTDIDEYTKIFNNIKNIISMGVKS